MQIVGMDIHRSFAQVAILEDGTIIRQLRVDLVHDRLVAFAKTLSLEDEVVIEVTGNSAAVERILRPHVKRVAVANPRLVRAIAYARVKTDKVDAGTLAKLHFQSPDKLSSYFGLTPRVRQSGEHPARHGRISKQGNRDARKMLVEAAWSAKTAPGMLPASCRRSGLLTRTPTAAGDRWPSALARDVADRGQHSRCDDRTHAGDRHQLESPWIVQSLLGHDFVDLRQLLRHAFEFRDQTPEHCTLLRWKRQTVQPMLSALAEEIAFVGRDEVGMQDSLHASFNPDDLRQDGRICMTTDGVEKPCRQFKATFFGFSFQAATIRSYACSTSWTKRAKPSQRLSR
ncbi:hypothetical protein AB7M49_004100 [Bradyrhizobium elkanii]